MLSSGAAHAGPTHLHATAAAGAQVSFTRAWGWGVADGAGHFENCTTTCQRGIAGGGAGQLDVPLSVAADGSGDVFIGEYDSHRVDEFSSSGAFIKAWGSGDGGAAGQFQAPAGIAVDGSGAVFVADSQNSRIDEFSSSGVFIKAWGWGVLDGASQLETCTTSCQVGARGAGAGQLDGPQGIAVDGSGDVFVADNSADRLDEFSSAGAFIQAWGWGVLDGASQFETCTTTCRSGLGGSGAGQLAEPEGVALDGSADLFVADSNNQRVDEFSSSGAFVKAWGWGVLDGASQFETCTTTCQRGTGGSGAGQFLYGPTDVAVDGSGDLFVAGGSSRISEFSSAGVFIQTWGWGVLDGASHLETCITTCRSGVGGSAAGQLYSPIGVAVDGSSDVFDIDNYNQRVDEFTAPLPQDTLTVSPAGTGSGTVTSADAGISCPGTCSHGYASGTMVTLTATPAAGSRFAGWSGGGCTGTGTCQVTLNADTTVTASFDPVSETLNVTRSGSGSGSVSSTPAGISCGSTCSHGYGYGTSVTLSAAPASGSLFSGWSGACTGTGSCKVTMTAAKSLSAAFTRKASSMCVVPRLKGKSLKAAKRAIKAHHCSVGKLKHAISTKVKKGHVISQEPKPGKRLEHGAKVDLVVSEGKG